MYRLLAIAKYEERYVIPTAHEARGAGRSRSSGARSTSTAAPAWAAPAPSARRPAGRCPRPSRPSTRCGQRQTTDQAADPGRPGPGQPAQLGRQGPPRRAVPAATRPGREAGDARNAMTSATASSRPPRRACSTRTRTGRAGAHGAAARSTSCRRHAPGFGCPASSTLLDATAPGGPHSTTSTSSTCAVAAASTSPAGPTATPAAGAWRCGGFKEPTARRLRVDMARRAARLPPLVLEFAAARRPRPAALALLQEHRAGLELLRLALIDAGSPYAAPSRRVCAPLPGPHRRTAPRRGAGRSRPAAEKVGLDPPRSATVDSLEAPR